MQLNAQRFGDFEDRGEARVAVLTERLVKAFTAQAGVFGHLRHALGPCNVSKRTSDASDIVRCLCQPGVEVGVNRPAYCGPARWVVWELETPGYPIEAAGGCQRFLGVPKWNRFGCIWGLSCRSR